MIKMGNDEVEEISKEPTELNAESLREYGLTIEETYKLAIIFYKGVYKINIKHVNGHLKK